MTYQASRIIEIVETIAGVTITLIQVSPVTGPARYRATAVRVDEANDVYETLWADWFLSLERAQAAIDALDV